MDFPALQLINELTRIQAHGAFGALAFGIGTSEVEHTLATQTLWQRKSKNMRISVEGELHQSVSSKDIILHIIGKIGTAGGTGGFFCSTRAASEEKLRMTEQAA